MTTRPAQNARYLTPKRAEFLKHFNSHPYITTEQAYLLAQAKTDTDKRGLRRFLMLLWKSGYLLREPVLSGKISPFPHYQYSYRLSKHGAKAVTGRFSAEKSPASLTHDQEITTFHIEIMREFVGQVLWQQRDLKKTVYPDALFALSKDGKSAPYFFLEIEKSRQGHYRDGESGLVTKLQRYDKYRKTAKCRQEWIYFDDFRVAVVVKNETRRQNLLSKLSSILPFRFIWITTEEHYKRDIMGSIWCTPKDHLQRSYSFNDIT